MPLSLPLVVLVVLLLGARSGSAWGICNLRIGDAQETDVLS